MRVVVAPTFRNGDKPLMMVASANEGNHKQMGHLLFYPNPEYSCALNDIDTLTSQANLCVQYWMSMI